MSYAKTVCDIDDCLEADETPVLPSIVQEAGHDDSVLRVRLVLSNSHTKKQCGVFLLTGLCIVVQLALSHRCVERN